MVSFYQPKKTVLPTKKLTVTLHALDSFGQGVAYSQGKTIFVKSAQPNESVDIVLTEDKKQYAKAKVIKYHNQSNERIENKKNIIADKPYHYWRRARLAINVVKNELKVGFRKAELRLKIFAEHENISLYLHGEQFRHLSGKKEHYYLIVLLKLIFSPLDFIQINSNINQKMIVTALDWLDLNSNDHVLDLFCGMGNFSLPLATRYDSVSGVEGIKVLVKMAPDKIVYVSCNPATLARDSQLLIDAGYDIARSTTLDMFLQTKHVESMLLFMKLGS